MKTKTWSKKILALMLIVAMVMAIMPFTAVAEDDEPGTLDIRKEYTGVDFGRVFYFQFLLPN